MMFRFRSYPGLSFAYAHMANLHFAIFHTISAHFLENEKLSENQMYWYVLRAIILIKKRNLKPSQAPRSGRKIWSKMMKNQSRLLFGACGSASCSPPARYRPSRTPEKCGGERGGGIGCGSARCDSNFASWQHQRAQYCRVGKHPLDARSTQVGARATYTPQTFPP